MSYYDPRCVYQEHLAAYNLIQPTRNLLDPIAPNVRIHSHNTRTNDDPSHNTKTQTTKRQIIDRSERKAARKQFRKSNNALLNSKKQELSHSEPTTPAFNEVFEQLQFIAARNDLDGIASADTVKQWRTSQHAYQSDLRSSCPEPSNNQRVPYFLSNFHLGAYHLLLSFNMV